MTVAELLQRISSRELSEWMAYYRLEPFGDERGDLQAGIVASAVYNVYRDPRKTDPFEPRDFLLEFAEPEEEEKPSEQVYGMFRSWAILMGAKPK
jgi:hypothetical protein